MRSLCSRVLGTRPGLTDAGYNSWPGTGVTDADNVLMSRLTCLGGSLNKRVFRFGIGQRLFPS
jgi:hypothetical protein